jgi:hypothetical protein
MCANASSFTTGPTTETQFKATVERVKDDATKLKLIIKGAVCFIRYMEPAKLREYCRGRPFSELVNEAHATAYWNLFYEYKGNLVQMELATRTKDVTAKPKELTHETMLELSRRQVARTEEGIRLLNGELQGLSGKVVVSEHQPESKDHEAYSLDPEVIRRRLEEELKKKKEEEDDEESDTVSSEEEEEEEEQRPKREREEEEEVLDLGPKADVIDRVYKREVKLTPLEHLNKGVKTVVIANEVHVLELVTGLEMEIECVEAFTAKEALALTSSRTWGEVINDLNLFWNLAHLSNCNERWMRSVCAIPSPSEVAFAVDEKMLHVTQGGRIRSVALIDFKNSSLVGNFLKYCTKKTMDQILEERGSSTFWLLMYYCKQQSMQMTQVVAASGVVQYSVYCERIAMSRATMDLDIISSQTVDFSRFTNGGMLDTTDMDALLLLLQGHDPKILPTVQCFNSHSLDLFQRNRFPEILSGKELLLFNLFEVSRRHFYEVAFSVRAKTFFVFDSIPQSVEYYQQQQAMGQLATILGVNGSCNVQLVQGPVQRPGSNDCALFSIVAQHLLSTIPFNELVTMDCQTWKMSVNPSNWWSAELISELRPTLLLHLQKQALLPVKNQHQDDVVVVTVLNEEGKRPRAEETAQEQGEKRANNNNNQEQEEVVVEFN